MGGDFKFQDYVEKTVPRAGNWWVVTYNSWLIFGNEGFSRGEEWGGLIEGWDIFLFPATPASEAEEVQLP